jgi:hypothetical protein
MQTPMTLGITSMMAPLMVDMAGKPICKRIYYSIEFFTFRLSDKSLSLSFFLCIYLSLALVILNSLISVSFLFFPYISHSLRILLSFNSYRKSKLSGVDRHAAAVHEREDVRDGLLLQDLLAGDGARAVVGQGGREHGVALAVHLQRRQLNTNF